MTISMRIGFVILVSFLAGCQSSGPKEIVLSQKGAVEMRAIQSRMFETGDRSKTIRTVIATLQDLGYSIEKVEVGAGTVSARKLSQLELSVSVFPRGKSQTIVRANATVVLETGSSQVDAPEFYQRMFFEPLSKALFLDANSDNGTGSDAGVAVEPSKPGNSKKKN